MSDSVVLIDPAWWVCVLAEIRVDWITAIRRSIAIACFLTILLAGCVVLARELLRSTRSRVTRHWMYLRQATLDDHFARYAPWYDVDNFEIDREEESSSSLSSRPDISRANGATHDSYTRNRRASSERLATSSPQK